MGDCWKRVGGFVGVRVAKHIVGMVVRRGKKTTVFCEFFGCVGVDDIGGRVGLVKPKSRGVVLADVAVAMMGEKTVEGSDVGSVSMKAKIN